ncbi:MAG TPA: outer membrane beta-barrel protein [Gammaproteobacteria bacterium]|nr:outer membrane beta-barrel protein [Gammaproteobacteria bacterium]
MFKRNSFRALVLGLILASMAYPLPNYAANYKRQSYQNTTTSNTRAPRRHYYKGEMIPKAVAAPARPYPPMSPIVLNDGPYVGIAAGYDSYKVQQYSQFTGTTNLTFNPTINATGLIGAILAGYGHYFSNALYLGFEAFLNVSQAYQSTNIAISDSTDNINYNAKFFVSTGYGANLLPGIKLSDSALAFLRLGFQVARLRGQENITDNGVLRVSNTSSWSGGFDYGLGFEEAMVENLSLRGEYVHTDYRSFTGTFGTQYSPSNNQFLLTLLYHFT